MTQHIEKRRVAERLNEAIGYPAGMEGLNGSRFRLRSRIVAQVRKKQYLCIVFWRDRIMVQRGVYRLSSVLANQKGRLQKAARKTKSKL